MAEESPSPMSWNCWLPQFRVTTRKNLLLLSRSPLLLTVMCLSSIVSVIFAYLVVRTEDEESHLTSEGALTACGTVDSNYWDRLFNENIAQGGNPYDSDPDVPISYNSKWKNGFAVTLLTTGPFAYAAAVFLVLQQEVSTELYGMLRVLLHRNDVSVFLASWCVPFTALAFINALLAAITAKTIDVHLFQHVYFVGILGSFFFLNLALMAASVFLTAIRGTTRNIGAWLLFAMLVAMWIPQLLLLLDISSISTVGQLAGYWPSYGTSAGLWWTNMNTTTRQQIYQYTDYDSPATVTSYSCDKPLLAQDAYYPPHWDAEATEEFYTPDDYFLGCFFLPGFTNVFYNPIGRQEKTRTAFIFFFPYIHFTTIWSSFAGYTSMPRKDFTRSQASLSVEKLARESLPTPPNEDNAKSSMYLEQALTLRISRDFIDYTKDCEDTYNDEWGYYSYSCKAYCPAAAVDDDFCGNPRRETTRSPTMAPSLSPTFAFDPEPAPTFPFDSYYEEPRSSTQGTTPRTECSYVPAQSEMLESPSVHQMMAYLFALTVLYLLAAAYWLQVFPGKNGTPRPFYFFFLPSYWWGTSVSTTSGDSLDIQEVKKSYGDFEALRGVSIQLLKGEVSALLGHNGAGKSQLSHIIAGEIPATSGDVSLFGVSVSQHPATVQSMIGVCRQDDYLYPDLTAREHLELYGGLRGVSPDRLGEVVDEWLESVDLSLVGDDFTSTYSGGMKRRLSVALATIGEKPLLIFDEPTTGMDPSSRRFVWKHIDSIKKDRVVLLTTHAMEEADLLADMVFIMRRGAISAQGSPLSLKAEYGSALQFTILVEDSHVQSTVASIGKIFVGFQDYLKIEEGSAGNITVSVNKVCRDDDDDGVPPEKLAELVEWLDTDTSNVQEYGFSNSSLEEVFLKVTEGDVEVQENEAVEGGDASTRDEEAPDSAEGDIALASFKPELSVGRQVIASLLFAFTRHWTGRSSAASWIMYSLFSLIVVLVGMYASSYFEPALALATPTGALSMMIISTTSPIYTDRYLGTLFLQRSMGFLRNSFILSNAIYAFVVHLVYGILLVSLFYATPLFRDPKLCQYNQNSFEYCRAEKFGPLTYEYMSPIRWWSDTYEGRDVSLYASHSPGGFGYVLIAPILFALAMPGATFAGIYIPSRRLGVLTVMICAFCASLTPMILYIVTSIKRDRESSNGTLDSCSMDICSLNITQMQNGELNNSDEAFLQDGETVINCLGYSLYREAYEGLTGFGSLCMAKTASFVPQVAFFQMLSLSLLLGVRLTSDPPEYYRKVVGFAFIGIVLLAALGLVQVVFFDYPPSWIVTFKDTVSRSFKSFRNVFRRRRTTRAQSGGKSDLVHEEVTDEKAIVDSYMQMGVFRTRQGEEPSEQADANRPFPPILMHQLRKIYPGVGSSPPKLAVDDLNLHVEKGKVLGLLGQNGCGKSTTLKILSISHEATSGDAFVSGYSVSQDHIPIFERLGSCPQFDVVWPQLTVKQHLEFFSALKGLPRKETKAIAFALAQAVGLGTEEAYNRRAGDLSGGMRRRLSMAISLVGAPDVLLLDEPSTGLDPSTRNSIWGLVHSFATPERALIITTHMMIEADTLCNRIAIMAHGKLKVVATQQHLKNKFGNGYLLQLNLLKGDEEDRAMAFVRENVDENAILQSKQAKTLYIVLPHSCELDLKRVFRALYSPEAATEGGVNQFLLSQSSLEDVFLSLCD